MNTTSEIAILILNGFNEYREMFQSIAREAKDCFQQSQWKTLQEISSRRIDLYGVKVSEVAGALLLQQKTFTGSGQMLSRITLSWWL